MKTKTANYRPFGIYLEDKCFGTFVLNFVEHRGDTRHCMRVHLDDDCMRALAYRMAEQVQYAEKILADIKTALRNAGGGS